jgi:transcriptional regulator with XRE-family HTH domain
MAVRKDPFAIAWLVGNELRQARVRVGETQGDAAAKIGIGASRMNYTETGRSVQQPDDVRALMAFYGRPEDGERLASMLVKPNRRVWWSPWKPAIPEYNRLFIGLEGFATGEFAYVPSIVPGLLQTSAYSTALIGTDQVSPLLHDRIVEFRQIRAQRLLDEDDPLHLAVVVDEHTLDRAVGGTECLREQLEHLLVMSERDNVTVQVVPATTAVHDGLAGPFKLLDFAETQAIGCIDYPDGVAYVPDYHQVAGYHYRRTQLQAVALDPARSREVIAARREALD